MSPLRIVFEFNLVKEPLTSERATEIWGEPADSKEQVEYAQNLVHEQALLTALNASPLEQAYWYRQAWDWMEQLSLPSVEIEDVLKESTVFFDIHSLAAGLDDAAKKYFLDSNLLAGEYPGPLLYWLWDLVPTRILVEDGTSQFFDISTLRKQLVHKGKLRSQPKRVATSKGVRAVLEFTKTMKSLTPDFVDELWGPAQTMQAQAERAEDLPHEQALIDAVQAQPGAVQKLWVHEALSYLSYINEDFVSQQMHGIKPDLPLAQLVATLPETTQHYFSSNELLDNQHSIGPLTEAIQQITLSRIVFEDAPRPQPDALLPVGSVDRRRLN